MSFGELKQIWGITHTTEWSQALYKNSFADIPSNLLDVPLGAASVIPEKFEGQRWMQWEAVDGLVYLRELWLERDLADSTVRLRLGDGKGGTPIAVSIFSRMSESIGDKHLEAWACFALTDGTVYVLYLSSHNEDSSLLASVVHENEGW